MTQMVSTTPRSDLEGLPLPSNLNLPFFAYGAFKPSELAHSQIACLLSPDHTLIAATVDGKLLLRDGLPLFDPHGGESVQGFLLQFAAEKVHLAYRKICQFEPKEIYSWAEIDIESRKANILHGKKLDSGNPVPLESNEWTFRMDPVFKEGLEVVEHIANELTDTPFKSDPYGLDWNRFFRIQAAYLLLWSAMERFCSFAYGPALEPMKKIRALDCDPRFRAAFKEHVKEQKKVFDSRNPKTKIVVDPAQVNLENSKCPCRAAEFYYQVRNNLSHRGKGAWQDGEMVRQSLHELLAIFRSMLNETPIVTPSGRW